MSRLCPVLGSSKLNTGRCGYGRTVTPQPKIKAPTVHPEDPSPRHHPEIRFDIHACIHPQIHAAFMLGVEPVVARRTQRPVFFFCRFRQHCNSFPQVRTYCPVTCGVCAASPPPPCANKVRHLWGMHVFVRVAGARLRPHLCSVETGRRDR